MLNSDTIRVMPHNDEAERSTLGAALIDNRIMDALSAALRAGDFYRESHRHIWRAMLTLHKRGEALDTITLADQLNAEGQLDLVGGPNFIARLSSEVPSAANFNFYAQIVKRKSTLRQIITAGHSVIDEAYEDVEDFDGWTAGALDRLTKSAGLDRRAASTYLPANIELENYVLGRVIWDARLWSKVEACLDPEDFKHDANRRLYRLLKRLADHGLELSRPVIQDAIYSSKDDMLIEQSNVWEWQAKNYLGLAQREDHKAASFDDLLVILSNYGRQRRLILELQEVLQAAQSTAAHHTEDLFAAAAARFAAVLRTKRSASYTTLREAEQKWALEYEERELGNVDEGMRTGLVDLDELLGGWHTGRSIVIAGLSKMGKTKFTAQVVLDLVQGYGCAVDWYSVEMTATTMAQRAVSYRGTLRESTLRRPLRIVGGEVQYSARRDMDHQRELLKSRVAIQQIGELIRFYNSPKPRLQDILLNTDARLAELQAEAHEQGHEPRKLIVVVDYIQRVDAGFSGSSAEYQNVTEASQQLTGSAIEKGFLGLYVSHFNRGGAKKGAGVLPSPSDMRGSGAIEQDCDACLVVHRPFWDEKGNEPEDKKRRRLTVVWQSISRHTEPGTVHLDADLDCNTFTRWDGEIPPYEGGE